MPKADDLKALVKAKGLREAAKPTNQDFAIRVKDMSPRDIAVARAKNDAFGKWLREQAMKPREGEASDARHERLTGATPERARELLTGVETPGTAEGVGRAAFQGLSFGTGDEIAAALASTVGPEKYGDYLGAERARIERFREDQPVAAIGSEVAGAVPTALVAPWAAAGTKGPLAARLGVGTGVGATEGGAYGYAAGEGEGRLGNAGVPAMVGGLIGSAAVPVGAGVRNIANRLMAGSQAGRAGMERPAYEMMARTMEADGSLGPGGAARLSDPESMLADAGPSAMTMLDTAAQRSGPAATIVRNAVDDRVARASGRVDEAMDATLGQPQGVRQSARDISESTREIRQATYDEAYSKPIDYSVDTGRRIEEVLGRVPNRMLNEAIAEANEDMVSRGVRNMQIAADIADDGTVTFREMPNVQQLDAIKRALQATGREAVDQFGRPTQAGARARRLGNELRDALGEAVPEYNAATAAGADKIAMDQALDLGRRALSRSVTRETVAEGMEGASPAERLRAAQGVRAAIDETLANVKRAMTDGDMDAREAGRAIRELSSRAAREKVSAIVGDEAAGRMFDEIDQAARAFEMRAGIAKGSQTFARTSMDDMITGATDDGVMNAARSGEFLNLRREGVAPRIVQALAGRTEADKARIADETYAELAKALTRQGTDAQELLTRLQGGARIPAQSEQAGLMAQRLLGRSAAPAAMAQPYR